MSTAVAKKSGGRPTKLTDEVRAKMLHAFRLGASVRMACAAAGVSEGAYREWMARGRGDDPDRPRTPLYAAFAREVREAQGFGDIELLESVRYTVNGKPCTTCDGSGAFEGAEGLERCPICRGSTFATRPDGRLALQVLERRHPEHFGKRDRVEVEQKVSGSVQVDIRTAALTVNLAEMSPEQLRALTAGGVLEISAEK